MYKFFMLGIVSLVVGLATACLFAQPVAAAGSTLATGQTSLVASASLDKLEKSWSWYVSRASGLLAALLLVLLVMSGVGLLTGQTYRILEPLPAWAAHRAIGLAFVAMVAIHGFVLLFDQFVGFSLVDILVPFAADYKPVIIGGVQFGSLYLALGIVAFYAILAIVATSIWWINRKQKQWRLVHYASYFVLAAVAVHGLLLGTDLKGGVLRFLWFAAGLVLAVSIIQRIRRAHTIGKNV